LLAFFREMAQDDESFDRDTLRIPKLRLSRLRTSCLVGLVAQKGSGKSTVVKHLLFHRQNTPGGVCFTPSGESNGEYRGMFPDMFMYSSLDLAQFEEIFNYQTEKTKRYKRHFTREEKADFRDRGINPVDLPLREKYVRDPTIILVLEDMMSDKKVFNKPIIRALAINGRHQNIFAIITCQYVMDLPPTIRQNIDYWFLFKEDNSSVRQKLFDMFAKVQLKTLALFNEMMDSATADHRVLFVDSRVATTDPRKKFAWFRANHLLPPFRIGCDRYWRFSKKNFHKPESTNKLIALKYRNRIGNTDCSEAAELADRAAAAQGGTYNAKRKRNGGAVSSRKKTKAIVLEDSETSAQDGADQDEGDASQSAAQQEVDDFSDMINPIDFTEQHH